MHIDMLAGIQTRVNDDGAIMNLLFNCPNFEVKHRLLHASWYIPAYRLLRSDDSAWIRLNTWALASDTFKLRDDPYGIWRNIAGISEDVRTENYEWLN